MTNPSVACVMLANGRPEMTRRAIASFERQTYAKRRLLIWDTGEEPLDLVETDKTTYCYRDAQYRPSIGELRNEAIGHTNADIIVTFDSDDLSHPRRIEEQVALLMASEAEAVGYREVLFWNTVGQRVELPDPADPTKTMWVNSFDNPGCSEPYTKTTPRVYGESWLYSNPAPNYAIGASLAFWRSTWKRRPFPHLPISSNRQSAGEDAEWLKGVRSAGVSGMHSLPDGHRYDPGVVWKGECAECGQPEGHQVHTREPRLIASIHGANSQAYELALPSPYFKRAAQWDDFCRKEMAL